jgi:hypothetical protein
MAGRVLLAALAGACLSSIPSLHAAEPTDKTMYFMLLQNDLQRTEAELVAAKKNKGPEFPAGYYQLEVKLLRQQVSDARQDINNGKEFGQAEYLKAIKDRAKAHGDKTSLEFKDTDTEVKQASIDTETNRQADLAKAERDYATVAGKAPDHDQGCPRSDELLGKFRTSNGELRLVIWNLPLDGSIGKRTTRIVNVALLAGKKVVWQQSNVKLDRRQASTDVALPVVMFDEVAVEVAKWSGDGGGLAEVEVYVGKENVALHRPCKVISTEGQPAHLNAQEALTDGVTAPGQNGAGYWLAEAKKKGAVRIDLLGPINTGDKDAAHGTLVPAAVR